MSSPNEDTLCPFSSALSSPSTSFSNRTDSYASLFDCASDSASFSLRVDTPQLAAVLVWSCEHLPPQEPQCERAAVSSCLSCQIQKSSVQPKGRRVHQDNLS